MALVESLAAGVPVLASNILPLNNYLPEDFLTNQWGKESVEKAIKNLYKDQYNNLARETAEKMNLNPESVVDSYLDPVKG